MHVPGKLWTHHPSAQGSHWEQVPNSLLASVPPCVEWDHNNSICPQGYQAALKEIRHSTRHTVSSDPRSVTRVAAVLVCKMYRVLNTTLQGKCGHIQAKYRAGMQRDGWGKCRISWVPNYLLTQVLQMTPCPMLLQSYLPSHPVGPPPCLRPLTQQAKA